ncbi:MAG: signal transduction protein [Hyphomonadaceae bacterium]|nr:MAG: signal transduction protein [Hyphomonadaceae bacterium]
MIIKNIISTKSHEILTVTAKNTLREAATILVQKKIGALPVVDSVGGLIGIISERDIVRICASDNADAMGSLVEGAMTTKLEVASPDDSVDMALARMTDRRIRHLPVVENGKLVGIVSIGDLVKIQIDRALAEADAMRAYIQS